MASVRTSLALSFAERYVLIALSFVSNILIARLLSPEQIGLFSVTLAVIGVAQVIRDFGLGSYLIQEHGLTEAHVRTAFGMSLLLGGTLFLAILIAAPGVARYYGNEAMIRTLQITSLNFLVLPFCSISLSLLRREMAFGKLMAVNFSAGIAGFIVIIALAYAGFGPDALAVGAVSKNLVTGIAAWIARGRRRPLMPSLSEWRTVLNFGGQSTAANVVTSIAMDINDLAVGKILGFGSVAMISRAQGLMNLYHRDLMAAVRNVLFPAFAQGHREGRSLESGFAYAVSVVTVIGWPFYGFVAIFPLEILRLLFGPQWDEAAPLVRWFCVAGAFAATWNLVLPLIIAVGRIDIATRTELILQPLRAAMLIGVVVYFRSLEAFAVSFAIVFAAFTPAFYLAKGKVLATDWRTLSRGLLSSAAVTLACLLPALLVALESPTTQSGAITIQKVMIAGLLTIAVWIVALRMVRHPLAVDPMFRGLMSRIPLLRSLFP
ncbi:lipopolysaccharide biosynthesis protein [Zeimonas arvi]|uniref:Lipopolysaccharide biosynthesis protein n=1 Tax=Zeimonas arvi TaxID=2498847 RepID=A0A5C8NY91_9BURK|nr:lipopolysaccharide biosynthesis protein [Zeimonas arvi]TXL65954.1 lipopolysaccharide biosynthesis protein [Zeimonas arvi]